MRLAQDGLLFYFAVLQVFSAIVITPVVGELTLEEIAERYTKRTPGGIHLPILPVGSPSILQRRGVGAAIGLGDRDDSLYTVLVSIGRVAVPLLLETADADVWVVSDACPDGCNSTSTPKFYPQETFQSTGVSVRVNYGPTFMSGLVGTDSLGVGVGGLGLRDQVFTSTNRTNSSLVKLGISGVFGLGFPIDSFNAAALFRRQFSQPSTLRKRQIGDPNVDSAVDFPSASHEFMPSIEARHELEIRQTPSPDNSAALVASWINNGPLISRLVMQGALLSPLIAITLQRDTIDIGGNLGMLSIGQLPSGVKSSDMTWVPLRTYTADSGGIIPPTNSPTEVYPLYWEVMIDNVYFDGEKLPASTLSSSGMSGLIATSDPFIHGPSDTIDFINQRLGTNGIFRCADPHVLSFEIGGKIFPVDPRDFLWPITINTVESCKANIGTRSPPRNGLLFSWTLGSPFLKGVLASLYYGNITNPTQDPAKVGLLSTVPANAGDLLKAAVASARTTGNFTYTTQLAPSNLPTAGGTDSHGVPQALATPTNSTATATATSGDACGSRLCLDFSELYLFALSAFSIAWWL